MYLRRCFKKEGSKRYAYWALVESYRTERGPRQRVVAHLGQVDEAGRLGVLEAAGGKAPSPTLFDAPVEPSYIPMDPSSIRVERVREMGGPWLALEIAKRLGIDSLLERLMPPGREKVPWPLMSLVLVISRLLDPSSELKIAEHGFSRSALSDLLGIPADKVNDDRLYRALDELLPHKEELEKHLKQKMGELFKIEHDLLLYDMTSTYFEGQCENNPLAQRGYSRDQRFDCKQVCIAMVVSRCGLPLGYEVFAGNRADVTTVEEIVEAMEERHGVASRVWVMDRGMVSEDNIEFLQEGGRKYILGTPKSQLKKYEQEILSPDWTTVHKGLEVRTIPGPEGDETFILCRSADRKKKEQAMHEKFVLKIKKGLEAIEKSCRTRKQNPMKIAEKIGRLLGKNTRGQGAFKVDVTRRDDGFADLKWSYNPAWQDWATLSEGCYMLRTNVTGWTGPELWQAYIQLTEAENAFRIQKSDLSLRPVWHQKEDRVRAHILVCFLAYAMWKTLGRWCKESGLGDEPRKVIEELKHVRLVDVVINTKSGTPVRRRCVTRPDDHQAILLAKLKLTMPSHLRILECSEEF